MTTIDDRPAVGLVCWNEMLRASGASKRMIDYWTRAGYLRLAAAACGSGIPRCWLPGEQIVAAIMVRLINAGITPQAAEMVARGSRATTGGAVTVEIADGVYVSFVR